MPARWSPSISKVPLSRLIIGVRDRTRSRFRTRGRVHRSLMGHGLHLVRRFGYRRGYKRIGEFRLGAPLSTL